MTEEHLTLITVGALVLFLAAGLGAYGTHAVQGAVDARRESANINRYVQMRPGLSHWGAKVFVECTSR